MLMQWKACLGSKGQEAGENNYSKSSGIVENQPSILTSEGEWDGMHPDATMIEANF